MEYKLNLQRFAEEGTESAAPEAASAETAAAAVETADFQAGEKLAEGTVVSSQVAAEMNRQMAKHPELRKVYGQARTRAAAQAQQEGQPEAKQPTIEDEWNELRNGKYKDLYGRDVRDAVQQRFKNQADATAKLQAYEPMMEILRERAGVQTDEELINMIMDDDSLYEEAASEAGMTIPAYKQFMALKQEKEESDARAQQAVESQMLEQHFANLTKQAEEFRKEMPTFDLMENLHNDPNFLRLTSPEVGLSVKQAYIALHHNEIMPQAMMAGMERAKQQLGQTIQAQRQRPAEGAMKGRGPQAADFNINPKNLSRNERSKLYDLIHKGVITWGG